MECREFLFLEVFGELQLFKIKFINRKICKFIYIKVKEEANKLNDESLNSI